MSYGHYKFEVHSGITDVTNHHGYQNRPVLVPVMICDISYATMDLKLVMAIAHSILHEKKVQKNCLKRHYMNNSKKPVKPMQYTCNSLVAIVVSIAIVVLPLFYFPLFIVVYNLGLTLAEDLSYSFRTSS